MRRITPTAFFVLLILYPCFPQGAAVPTGSIRGDILTKDAGGMSSVIPDAHVELHGIVVRETQSDARGAYAFNSIPQGKYTVEASAIGLIEATDVDVKAGVISVAPLVLEIVAVSSTKPCIA